MIELEPDKLLPGTFKLILLFEWDIKRISLTCNIKEKKILKIF